MKRVRIAFIACTAVLLVAALFLWERTWRRPHAAAPAVESAVPAAPQPLVQGPSSGEGPTHVFAHNLLLRKGPNFRVYVNWLRGRMIRSHRERNPSFDEPESFYLDIEDGIIRANLADINKLLNANAAMPAPLRDITMSGEGDQVKVRGTLHKVLSFPVELDGTLSAVNGNSMQLHVTKLNVLKIPFKAILGGLHITVADLIHPKGVEGIRVAGNDLFFDTQKLLPPPHIRGRLTSVRIKDQFLEEVYGNVQNDVTKVEQWRNFLRLRDGTLDFGKLTMNYVDLIMIDISNDDWFDLDLAHYQSQLVRGYTRMTPQAGLQIFMPDLDDTPVTREDKNVSIEWFKNRKMAPPPDVMGNRR